MGVVGEKVTLNYVVGEHPEIKGRIIVAFDNTGIDINDKDHKHFVDTVSKVMITQMYAKANNIPIENIEY